MAVTTCRHGTQPESRRRFQRRHAILRLLPRASSHSTITKTMPALDIGAWDNRRNLVRAARGSTASRPAAQGRHDGRPSGALGLLRDQIRSCRPRSRSGGHRPSPGTKDRRGIRTRRAARLRWSSFHPAPISRPPEGGSRGAVLALGVGNQLDLDIERQGAKRAGEAVSAVKVPMFAMMNFLSVEQGSRPSRPVVIRPATARIHKQTGRLGPTRSERNMADSASRVTASPACALARARTTPSDKVKAPDVAGGLLLEAWRGSAIARPGGVSVNRPS